MPKAGSRGGAQTAKSALEADYLSVSLGNPEMIKRLKVVTELLEAYGDDDQSVEKAKSEVGQLASTLGEDWLIEHKSKDVRLLAACALADILRLYAPEPPYSDECSADIIRLFIKIIRGFESPDMTTNHPSYRVHFYLLERLSNISIFSIIPDLLHFREALMLELTNASYAVVGNMPQHESTQKIADHLTSILCAVLEETESHDIEIFDKVVGALCQEEKRTNPAGHAMMKQVIASCENKFQPYVERQLHQVKAGFLMESELSNADRLEEAVFELCTCAPRVLTQVLPAYTEDLTVDEPERRIKAIKLLGAIFSVGTFRSDFGQVFAEFKRRTGDKDVDVRKAMISVMHHLILKRPELAPGFIQESYIVAGEDREAPFMRLIIDGDEGVRKQAIISGVDICLHHAEAVPLAFLEQVGGRVRDKKESVRRAAAEGLAKLWHKHCAPFDLDDLTPSIANRFGWIPSKIVGLTNMDQAAKNLAEHCIDLCLASSPVPRGAPSVALDFYSSLDAPGTEMFNTSLKAKKSFRESFLKLCQSRSGGDSFEMEDGEKEEGALSKKLSASFLDPVKASEHLEKLEKTNVAKVWEILEGMVRKPGNAAAVKKQQDDILKRLGPRSPLLDFVKQLVAALVDPHFGFDFVNHVFTGISAKNSAEVARAKGGLRLLPALADVNPALFASQEAALEKMVLQQDDKGMAEHFLATLAACAGSMPALYKNRKLLAGLEANCAQSSWTVAKHAARTMVALGQTQFDKLVDSCTRNLTLGPRLPAVLRVLLEIAKAAPDEVMGEREAIQGFVLKKLLHTAWPNAAGKKSDKSIATEARAHGLKLLATLLIHAGPDAPGMRDKVLGAFIDTILQGGEMGKEAGVPRADKATLRLVAGSCILRVARAKPELVTPQAFSALGRLFEDDEGRVKRAVIKKVYRGRVKSQGVLPLQFAGLLCLVAHDAEPGILDLAKKVLKNIVVSVVKIKVQSGKTHVAILPERLLAWLVYALVVHPEYAGEEDGPSVSLAYKKYIDFFIGVMTGLPADEQCAGGIPQLFKHLRHCTVPRSAAGDTEPKDVARNLNLITQTGITLSGKLQGNKLSGCYASMSKVVDACIFTDNSDAGASAREPRMIEAPAHAQTPDKGDRSNPTTPFAFSARDMGSDASSNTSPKQQRPSAAKPAARASTSSAKSSGKRKAPPAPESESEEEGQEDKENESEEEEEESARPGRKSQAPATKRAAPSARGVRGKAPPKEKAAPKEKANKRKADDDDDSALSVEDTPDSFAPKRKSASKSPALKTPNQKTAAAKKQVLTPFDDFGDDESDQEGGPPSVVSLASSKKDQAARRLSTKSKASLQSERASFAGGSPAKASQAPKAKAAPAPKAASAGKGKAGKPTPPSKPAAAAPEVPKPKEVPMARPSSVHVVSKARPSSVHDVAADKAALWDQAVQQKVEAHGAAAKPAIKKKRRL